MPAVRIVRRDRMCALFSREATRSSRGLGLVVVAEKEEEVEERERGGGGWRKLMRDGGVGGEIKGCGRKREPRMAGKADHLRR
jgi:hypothetical protein